MKSKENMVLVGGKYKPDLTSYYDAPIIRENITLEQLEKEIKEEEEKSLLQGKLVNMQQKTKKNFFAEYFTEYVTSDNQEKQQKSLVKSLIKH